MPGRNVGDSATTVVEVRDLRKTFHRRGSQQVHAVDGVSLRVAAGEMVVLLGPSGCGKTTLLRCIAGLEQPDSGECLVEGQLVSGSGRSVPPESRNIGMMFQSYALWPHMTVRKNVAYPLEVRRVSRAEIDRRVNRILEIVGVEALAEQHPGKLSGGQQQRVALARCLVAEPRVILFDEPLSNVDAKVRVALRNEIVDMQRRLGFAGIYVTHDQDEAMRLADRLAVMRSGRIVQLGTPQEVYQTPADRYVAEFIGEVNRWSARRASATGATGSSITFHVDGLGAVQVAAENVVEGARPDGTHCLLARPEAITLSTTGSGGVNSWSGTITRRTFAGAHTDYIVKVDGGTELRLITFNINGGTYGEGDRVTVSIDPRHLRVLPDDHPGEAEW